MGVVGTGDDNLEGNLVIVKVRLVLVRLGLV